MVRGGGGAAGAWCKFMVLVCGGAWCWCVVLVQVRYCCHDHNPSQLKLQKMKKMVVQLLVRDPRRQITVHQLHLGPIEEGGATTGVVITLARKCTALGAERLKLKIPCGSWWTVVFRAEQCFFQVFLCFLRLILRA